MFKKKLFYIHRITSHKDNNQLLEEVCKSNNRLFYSINLPGHSDNEFNDIDLSIEAYGEYVKDYIIKNKIKRNLILYGHSMGGAIATYIASKYKKKLKIKKLILEDPLNSAVEINVRGNNFSILNRKLKEVKKAREDNVNTISSSWIEWLKKASSRIPRDRWSSFAKLTKNIVSRETLENLDTYYRNLRLKTYIVFGENDFVIPCNESKDNLTSLNNKINFTILENAGHSPNKENPDKYKEWISNLV